MGNKTSRNKIRVEVSLPAGPTRLDVITMSCCRATCFGQVRCRLGRMKFRKEGWTSSGDAQECVAEHGLDLPVDRLSHEDGEAVVRVKCSHKGELGWCTWPACLSAACWP